MRHPSRGAPPLTGCAAPQGCATPSGVRRPSSGAPPLEGGAPPLRRCAAPQEVRRSSRAAVAPHGMALPLVFPLCVCFVCFFFVFRVLWKSIFRFLRFFEVRPLQQKTQQQSMKSMFFSQTWSRRTVRITVSRALCQVLCKVKQPPQIGGRVRKKSSPKQSSQENHFSLNVNFL